MEFINATRMVAGYNMGMEPSGRELLVVVIKSTFAMPKPGEPVRLHPEQLPLVMADTFTGEPGFSAPIHEVDFAPRKHACDVLLLGSAYAPRGKPTTRTHVSLTVGAMHKTIDVVGDRVWRSGLTSVTASDPKAFTVMPLSYDVAFGGVDQEHEDPKKHGAFVRNPVGRGYRKHMNSAWVDGRPLPNTEKAGEGVTWPDKDYTPMAFGPLGRGWQQRAQYAGTYDDKWLENDFPFLPKDFDERYYQAAPLDQQIPHPKAPVRVSMENLTADGMLQFALPYFEAPVSVFPKRGEKESYIAALDTIVLEPDAGRFTMSWRVARPLRKSLHEIAQVVAGSTGREWWQRREQAPPIVLPLPKAAEAQTP